MKVINQILLLVCLFFFFSYGEINGQDCTKINAEIHQKLINFDFKSGVLDTLLKYEMYCGEIHDTFKVSFTSLISTIYLKIGKHEESLEYSEIALNTFEDYLNKKRQDLALLKTHGNLLRNFSASAFALGKYKEAFMNSHQALELAKTLKDTNGILINLRLIGQTYRSIRLFNSCLRYYDDLIKVLQQKDFDSNYAVLKPISLIEREWARFLANGKMNYSLIEEELKEMRKNYGKTIFFPPVLNIYGAFLFSEKKYQKALDIFIEAEGFSHKKM